MPPAVRLRRKKRLAFLVLLLREKYLESLAEEFETLKDEEMDALYECLRKWLL